MSVIPSQVGYSRFVKKEEVYPAQGPGRGGGRVNVVVGDPGAG